MLPASPALVFDPIASHTYGDAPFSVSASGSTGLITYELLSGPGTMVGNSVSLQGAGSIVLRATQAEDQNYLSATVQTTPNVSNPSNTGTKHLVWPAGNHRMMRFESGVEEPK
jgi:hypothetical protein